MTEQNDYAKRDGLEAALIRIPKNASRAMAEALGMRVVGCHKPATLLVEEDGARFAAAHLVIACVRNPYDRLVSWYEFHCRAEPRDIYLRPGVEGFREWVAKCCPHRFHMGRWEQNPFQQWRWMLGCGYDRLALVRYEYLHTDWNEKVCTKFAASPLRLVNAGTHGRWRTYYDKQTATRATALVWEDADRYGYPLFTAGVSE